MNNTHTILPPSFGVTIRRLPREGSVAGYHTVLARLERDMRADATNTVRPGRVSK